MSIAHAWGYRIAERVAGRFRDATIVLSPQEADAALRAHVAKPSTIHIIPNGVSQSAHDRIAARNELVRAGVPEDALVIGCVANFYPVKNIPGLVKAFLKIKNDRIDTHLVLIGDGEDRPVMEKTTASSARIHLLGFRPDARALLDGCDLFVLPSHKEGFPFALLEAMEAALPCLATRVGGIPNIIDDGKNGWLTTPETLSDDLGRVLTLRSSWNAVGHAAQKTIHDRFEETRMQRETLRVYEELTKKISRPDRS